MPKLSLVVAVFMLCCARAKAQSLGAGTLKGAISDPSNAPVGSAVVELKNRITGYVRQTRTGDDGSFIIYNIPPNRYQLGVSFPGFRTFRADVSIQSAVPLFITIRFELAGQETALTVESEAGVLETKTAPSAIVDRQLLAALPSLSPDSGLNDSIVYTTAGVAADSNGFFHPMGDHAQVSYILDGQPISDQRNKVFSTSIPANAIQAMEVVFGSPAAEFGDKTSLIVNATTRSGLGQKRSGTFAANYGS